MGEGQMIVEGKMRKFMLTEVKEIPKHLLDLVDPEFRDNFKLYKPEFVD